ncbi:MAG: HIT family protein [Gemmatimonadetes bacterium]|nr:HIT family protein [Gemmatimonadota bacterium]MYG83955.1 HIT family protein [Gemmatimonadota bacterium]MYJ91143.1 HIT family protein [Gemmatimonadota bacterium]
MDNSEMCKTCEMTRQRRLGNAPLWDNVYQAGFWDVVHAYNSALPGWLVLVLHRHIESVDELTEQEAVELGILIRRVSLSLKRVLGCMKTYVIQFSEARLHPHVHFHIVPRMADQPDDRRSARIMGYLGVSQEECISEERMIEICTEIRKVLLSLESRLGRAEDK